MVCVCVCVWGCEERDFTEDEQRDHQGVQLRPDPDDLQETARNSETLVL